MPRGRRAGGGAIILKNLRQMETCVLRSPRFINQQSKKNIKMLSRVATTAAKRTAPLVVRQTARSASAVALSGARIAPAAAGVSAQHVLPIASPSRRSLSTAEDTDHHLAAYAYEKSCYNDMDFTINETDSMYNAVQKFSAFKVGSLVVVDGEGALKLHEAKAKKDRVG